MTQTQRVCLEALKRGPLVSYRNTYGARGIHWRFGRRLFSAATVNALIRAGKAKRKFGKIVRNRVANG